MNTHQQESLFGIAFLLLGLVLLYIGVRGLLGFAVVMPTKSSGLRRFTGRSARLAGGVALFYAMLFLGVSYAILR